MNEESRGAGSENDPSADSDEDGDADSRSTALADEASGFGLTMTLLTGVLLALAYYGVLGITAEGFGRVIPPPFYLLALALVFVVELSRNRSFDAQGLARAVGITAVFGTLTVLAVEGGAYIWEQPSVALEEFAGIAVLAVSLVVAALAYALYLSVTTKA